MSATKSVTVESFSSPNTKAPTERLNNFDLRLQVLSQDLNDSLVCITHNHDANKTQFDSVTSSISNLNSMCGQLTQSICPRTPNSCNKSKNGFSFKTFG